MTDPLFAATPEAASSEPKPQGRSAVRIVLVVATVVMLVVAAGAVVVGFNARSAADDERAEATTLVHERRVQEQARTDAIDQRHALNDETDKLVSALDTLGTASDHNLDAQNRVADEGNRATDIYNAGNTAGSEAIFQNDVLAALRALETSNVALHDALTGVHGARDQLQEDLR